MNNSKLKQAKMKCRQELTDVIPVIEKHYTTTDLFTTPVTSGWGAGRFKGLYWWKIGVNPAWLKKDYANANYQYIYLMPYSIDSEQTELLYSKLASQNDSQNSRYIGATEDSPYPHVDANTGNMHIDFKVEEWLDAPAIQQAILMRKVGGKQFGPKLEDKHLFRSDDLIQYHENLVLPRDCYFPPIDAPKKNCQESSAYELLEGLLDNVLDEEYKRTKLISNT